MDIILLLVVRVAAFTLGFFMITSTLFSAVQTFVLPRSARNRLTTLVFSNIRKIFDFIMKFLPTYRQRDHIMAFYAPVALLVLPGVWLILVLLGYMGIFWAVGVDDLGKLTSVSGSSLFTLGFATVDDPLKTVIVFSEAAIGLTLLALLIAYLPTMYSSFSSREKAVTLLEVRAGVPAWAVTMMIRFHRIRGESTPPLLHDMWTEWERWFAEIDESHTSLVAVVFFRSPQPDRSWVTAAGAVLDAAALSISAVDMPNDPQAHLCIRAGFVALRHIADFFQIPYNHDPRYPDDPISISRADFDAACQEMEEAGVHLKPDREQAWQDFAGWRVNYDTPLLALAHLTMAPEAPWLTLAARQRFITELREQFKQAKAAKRGKIQQLKAGD